MICFVQRFVKDKTANKIQAPLGITDAILFGTYKYGNNCQMMFRHKCGARAYLILDKRFHSK